MYRIYDKERKEYRKDLIVSQDWNLYCLEDETITWWIPQVWDPRNFIVEHSTWLRDKSWNLIYEGDAVRYMDDVNGNVYWCISSGWFMLSYDEDTIWWGVTEFDIWVSKECKIVGNIHENPEILD